MKLSSKVSEIYLEQEENIREQMGQIDQNKKVL